MAKTSGPLQAMLIDVALTGAVVIDKRKLLWLMGKGQDRPLAWSALADHWEEIGMERSDLEATEIQSSIVLMRGHKIEVEKVKKWAGE